ncbi:uncharacterized protein PG986_011191 [Apiospora aurea]|uniref:Uncharacterized protein n=1 Tax=Apiospora aurea TaxID=335848 RepID=A0ABR1Q4J8_9PEZI
MIADGGDRNARVGEEIDSTCQRRNPALLSFKADSGIPLFGLTLGYATDAKNGGLGRDVDPERAKDKSHPGHSTKELWESAVWYGSDTGLLAEELVWDMDTKILHPLMASNREETEDEDELLWYVEQLAPSPRQAAGSSGPGKGESQGL